MRLTIANLNNEGLDSVVVFEGDATREYDSVVRLQAESARPELGSFDSGRMDRELLSRWIVCGCSLQASYIRAMAKLSLSVASNYVQVVSLWQEVSLLLIRCKVNERVSEHRLMEGQGRLAGEHVSPHEMILILFRVIREVMMHLL